MNDAITPGELWRQIQEAKDSLKAHSMISGKIIYDDRLVEEGESYDVKRTWKERLFTLPWRPLKATKTITPMVPMTEALVMPDGTMVMHPKLAEIVNQHVGSLNGGAPCSDYSHLKRNALGVSSLTTN